MKNRHFARIFALLLAAVLLLGTVTGCSTEKKTATETKPAETKTEETKPAETKPTEAKTEETKPAETAAKEWLNIAGDDIVTFNPYMAVNGADILFMMHIIGEPLLLCTEDFQYEPLLAESYELSSDGTVYTFHLRSGVTFHDGSAFDSEDVKYSIESASKGSTAGELAYYIESIETPDAQTAVIKLNAPLSSFLNTLYTFVPMMPSGIFENGYDFEAHPIGTGPYEFVSFTAGDALILKAYDKYYIEGIPEIPNLKYRIITDKTTAFVALETGDLDYYAIQPTDISLAEKNKDLDIGNFPTYASIMAWMDNSVAPFDDINVRLALNYAVNREALAKVKGSSGYTGATTYTTPCCYGFNKDIEGYPYNKELAKEYLAKSSYSPEQISFTITTEDTYKIEAQFLQESFRDIGIENVIIETLEPGTFQAGIMTKQFPFGVVSVGLGISASASSIMFTTDAPINMMNYSNPAVDQAYSTAAVTADEQERLAAFHTVDENLNADAPFLPLLWSNTVICSRKTVDMSLAMKYASVTSEIIPQYVKAAK